MSVKCNLCYYRYLRHFLLHTELGDGPLSRNTVLKEPPVCRRHMVWFLTRMLEIYAECQKSGGI